MLVISLLVFFATSFFVCSWAFQRISINKFLVSFFLTTFSINILIFEFMSLLHRMNDTGIYLLLQAVLCGGIIAFLVFRKNGLKDLSWKQPFVDFRPIDYVLITCMVLILGGFFLIGISTAPNNSDGLNHHLLKIYYWLQHNSTESWPASWYPQLIYPVNAHFQGAWLFLLGRSEKLFFLVQWCSLVIITATAYEIARLLKFSPTKALLGALVGLSFPVALLQTYSFQGDLAVTALVMSCVYLGFSYRETHRLPELLGALLALALALGTKQTAFFVLPAICGLGIYWISRGRIPREHLPYLAMIAVFFLLFSAFKFMQNQRETGSILGNPNVSDVGSIISADTPQKARYNLPRLLYDFIGFDGMPFETRREFIQLKSGLFHAIDKDLNLNLEGTKFLKYGFGGQELFLYERIPQLTEDTAWFGPLGFLLLPLALGFGLFSRSALVREYSVFTLFLTLGYGFLVVLQWPGWDPYEGRYFITGLVPILPLIGILVPNRKGWQGLFVGVVTFWVLVLAFNTMLFNSSKPILPFQYLQRFSVKQVANYPDTNLLQTTLKKGVNSLVFRLMDNSPEGESIYDASRLQQVYYANKPILEDVSFILRVVPEKQPISLYLPGYSMEYGLFGENMTRKLFPLRTLLDYDGFSYLVLPNPVDAETMARWKLVASNQNYSVFFESNP
jgi:4-amino-4-deoxy-L-arabinose transferase-like glycosyltransferase